MADTLQVVGWSLSQGCALRAGKAITNPIAAHEAIAKAATYAQCIGNPRDGYGIYGDVLVTSISSGRVHPEKDVVARWPGSGFSISKAFGSVGGVAGLAAMCSACPANANRSGRPAGCAGSVFLDPDSPKLQDQLQRFIKRLRIQSEMEQNFLQTTPIWYGLWANSPLSSRAARLLRLLITELHDELHRTGADLDPYQRRGLLPELQHFIRALARGERDETPLSVRLAPPGHTDLGYYTIFPHCPVCKAEANLKRWQRRYPADLQTCRVCWHSYSPAETYSSKRDDWKLDDLRDELGPERYAQFFVEYLIANGGGRKEAEMIFALHEEAARRQQAIVAEQERQQALQSRYEREILFVGLHPSFVKDDPGDAHETPYFNANEFEELLRRCSERNIRITYMTHRSESGDFDKAEFRGLSRPDTILQKWRKAGCNERFHAGLKIPRRFWTSCCDLITDLHGHPE